MWNFHIFIYMEDVYKVVNTSIHSKIARSNFKYILKYIFGINHRLLNYIAIKKGDKNLLTCINQIKKHNFYI